jgi:hypothetical protein
MGSLLKFLTRYAQEGGEFLDHAPGDFHLFLHLDEHLAGKKFDDDDEVQEVVTWFKGHAAHFYDSGIQKLVIDLINFWTMPATVLKNSYI